MNPILCMITDGRHAAGSDDAAFVRTVRACARAGAHLIQIREHRLEAGHLARLVQSCVDVVAGTQARVIVNDRLDVALAARAHGVHLRETSIPPLDARAICPAGFLVGRSVHTKEDAARLGRDGNLDYLMFGTVFPSPSKPGAPAVGLDALRMAVEGTAVPVLAIGGVDASNAAEVGATGAAGLAAIRWWAASSQETLAKAAQNLAAAFAVGAASRR
jgi:thiamine-phosphate diphosphorylase